MSNINNFTQDSSLPAALWDEVNFNLDKFLDEESKLDIMMKEIKTMSNTINELKSMVYKLCSANRVLSSPLSASSSVLDDSQHSKSVFDSIVNNPEKIQEIVQDAASNRGLRQFDHNRIKVQIGAKDSQKMEMMLVMYYFWLEDKLVVYEGEENEPLPKEVQDNERRLDAERRYNKLYPLVKLFCSTIYADKHFSFRFNDFSKEEKQEVVLVVEYIVIKILGETDCFPVNLALESWVVTHLLSVVIKNEGNRKRSQQPNSYSTIQSDTITSPIFLVVTPRLEEDEPEVGSTGSSPELAEEPIPGRKRTQATSGVPTGHSAKRGRGRGRGRL